MSNKNLKKAIKAFKKLAKKKVAKKPAKKASKVVKKPVIKKKLPAKKPANPTELFNKWYSDIASKKVDKIEKKWIKENEPNDPNDDGGGDHWHVNEMMHNGDAHEMTAEIAEQVFIKGYNNEPRDMNQCESLYCELDSVINMAYEAGKNYRK